MFGKKSILLLITSLSLISYCGSFRENNIPTVKESEYKSDKTEKSRSLAGGHIILLLLMRSLDRMFINDGSRRRF